MNDLKASLATLRLDREQLATSSKPAWRWWLPCAVVAAVGAYAARDRIPAQWRAPTVEVVQPTVLGGSATPAGTPILTTTGYVVSRHTTILTAKTQGRIAELRAEEGVKVKRGDVIARLEDGEIRAQVRRARAVVSGCAATLAEDRRQLALSERLAATGSLPAESCEVARSKVRVSEAALEQARAEAAVQDANQEATLVRAPFAGTVVKKMAEVGESVAPLPPGENVSTAAGAIVAIADLDTLEVEADVGESSLAKLAAAQPAQVTIDALPDVKYEAVLRAIMPIANRTKGTVLVRVAILPAAGAPAPRPEMAAKVTFLESRAKADAPAPRVVLVPRAAIAHRGARDVVFELRGDRVHALPITAGEARGDLVTVKEGVTGSEPLVAAPSDALNDGDLAKVKK